MPSTRKSTNVRGAPNKTPLMPNSRERIRRFFKELGVYCPELIKVFRNLYCQRRKKKHNTPPKLVATTGKILSNTSATVLLLGETDKFSI